MTSTASITSTSHHYGAPLAPSPHEMVCLMLDGALRRLRQAQEELAVGASESLTAADRIVRALQDSLDLVEGGTLAFNLFDLYDYMLRRLGESAAARDPGGPAEVYALLETIQQGWEAIAPEVGSDLAQLAV